MTRKQYLEARSDMLDAPLVSTDSRDGAHKTRVSRENPVKNGRCFMNIVSQEAADSSGSLAGRRKGI